MYYMRDKDNNLIAYRKKAYRDKAVAAGRNGHSIIGRTLQKLKADGEEIIPICIKNMRELSLGKW